VRVIIERLEPRLAYKNTKDDFKLKTAFLKYTNPKIADGRTEY
jgi:hypothetical protein